MEEDHSTPSSLWCSYSCCNGSKAAAIVALSLSLSLHSYVLTLCTLYNSLTLLSTRHASL